MDTEKKKLLGMLFSVLDHHVYGARIRKIAGSMHLSLMAIQEEFVRYNLGTHDAIGNEVYKSIANRFVLHIHNLIDGSWHQDRQAVITKFVSEVNAKNVIDVGFGVPTRYVEDLVLQSDDMEVTFLDMYDSAFAFSEHLLDFWSSNWRDKIFFKKINMDLDNICGDYDLYIFQDSIEHTKNPAKVLRETVMGAANNARFIISLPIGPIFPRHYMEWLGDRDARLWVEGCGLKIEKEQSVYTKPEVDLFAKQIDPKYHDLYFLCSKQR
ncbi:MAG: hypothetical protein JXR42_01380 [Gammaproteobacteria bacterium]|nr:hypothetical protein [Gammaproteobacteria bacterium]